MCRCKAAVPPCPPFCLGPAHAFPMRIPQLGYGRAETGWSGLLFPQIPSKIKLFLSAACRNFPRMAAKLRPAWRLNSALPGVGQRRQDVRVNFPHAALRNSSIFSQVCGKSNPLHPVSALPYPSCGMRIGKPRAGPRQKGRQGGAAALYLSSKKGYLARDLKRR